MEQTLTQAKQRSCYKCGYQAVTAELRCPQCRAIVQTSVSIRIRGALLVICGVILIGMMGYISLWTMNVFSSSDPGGARFTGTHQQQLIIIALFASLLLFGVVSFVTGLWQLILGRRNKIFVRAVVGIAVLVALGGGAVIWLFDR